MPYDRLESDFNSRYTILDMDNDPPEKPESNRPPTFAGQAFDNLPPGDRLTHVAAVGNEQPPTGLQNKIEASLGGEGADMSQPPFVPDRSVAEIEEEQRKLEAEIGDGGPSSQTEEATSPPPLSVEQTPVQQTTSRREFLGSALRVGVPVVVTTAAVAAGEPEKTKNFLQTLGGLFNRFHQRTGEVAQAAATTPGQLATAAAEVIAQSNLTYEQQAALQQFAQTPQDKIIRNLKVIGENEVNLRTKPLSLNPENLKDSAFDLDISKPKLKPGDIISQAIVVKGQDPLDPTKANKFSDWYFIPDESGKSGSFVWSGNLVESSSK